MVTKMKNNILNKALYLMILLVIMPIALAGSWSGYVLDESDSPLNGVNVSAYDAGTDAFVSSTLTDASGFFNVTGVTTSAYLVSRLTGYDADTTQDLPPAGSNDYILPFNITLALSNAPGGISGTVTDLASSPLNGATVRVLQGGVEVNNTTTNAAGAYTLSGLSDGTYDVEASLSGYLSQTITNIVVNPGATTSGTDFALDVPPVCTDADSDGYGDPLGNYGIANGCTYDGTDCNEANAAVNPGVSEACDGIDNDCDGSIDEGCSTSNTDDDDDDGGSSSSRSSSGSRLSLYQIPIEFTEEFDENGEIIKELHRINILNFNLDDGAHRLEVLNVYVDKVTFTISSGNPVSFELFEKQTKKFDLNGDGLYDVSVTYLERAFSRIKVMIKVLEGASEITNAATTTPAPPVIVAPQPTISEPQIKAVDSGAEEITGSFWLADFIKTSKVGLFVTLGIVLGGVAIYFIFVRSKIISVY